MLIVVSSTRCRGVGPIQRPAWGLGLLVLPQISLGCFTWLFKYGWPFGFDPPAVWLGATLEAESLRQAMVTTAHVAVGSLILGTSTLSSLRSWRLMPAAWSKENELASAMAEVVA